MANFYYIPSLHNGIVHLTFPHRSTGWKSGVEMEVWKSGVEIFFHTTGWELCWNPLKSTENFMAQTNYPRKPWSNVVLWISNSFTPITNQFPTSGVEKNFHTGFPHLHFHTGFPTRWSVWKCQMYDAIVLFGKCLEGYNAYSVCTCGNNVGLDAR